MRVLHLFSNSKWTGPAEPALNLCLALRGLGIDADFACAPVSKAPVNKVVETARDRGIEPILRFRLNKHRHPIDNFLDRRALAAYLRERPYDLIHCHLDNDHRIAAAAAPKAGLPIVRSSYEGTGAPRSAAALVRSAAAVIEPSALAAAHDAESLGADPARLHVVPNAVDTERFDPARETPDGRAWLQIPRGAFVVGIVARMQTHRRFEDFWRAIRTLADAGADPHVVVVGRGTNQERVAMAPVRELGLAERVHFPGFVDGENYVGLLRAFDVKVYLVPGSDGTCRAVREALAMGKPCVVADRGMLREIVDDGRTGYVTGGAPEDLADRLRLLAADRSLRARMSHAARETALARYALPVQAAAVAAVYEGLLGSR